MIFEFGSGSAQLVDRQTKEKNLDEGDGFALLSESLSPHPGLADPARKNPRSYDRGYILVAAPRLGIVVTSRIPPFALRESP